MPTDKIDVTYVAGLANIELSATETDMFQHQLETIVGYVDKIAGLDLHGVEPTSYGQPLVNVMRSDEPREGLDREVALANAPARVGNAFKAPRILE